MDAVGEAAEAAEALASNCRPRLGSLLRPAAWAQRVRRRQSSLKHRCQCRLSLRVVLALFAGIMTELSAPPPHPHARECPTFRAG